MTMETDLLCLEWDLEKERRRKRKEEYHIHSKGVVLQNEDSPWRDCVDH